MSEDENTTEAAEETYTVACTIPHSGGEINGIDFGDASEDGCVAEGVPFDVAANFSLIPGYEVDPPIITVNVVTKNSSVSGGTPIADPADTGPDDDDNRELPISEMSAAKVVDLLKEHPAAWNDALHYEEQREKPRKTVMDAIEAAKSID